MIRRKSTFFLGIFIFLIPFLGLPSVSKTILVVLSGLTLIALSVKIIFPQKTSKPTIKRSRKKSFSPQDISLIENSVSPILPENSDDSHEKLI